MIVSEHVKTAIRWRTPGNECNDSILEKINDKILSFGTQRKAYTFDHVIDRSNQEEVYDILVKPLVEKSLEGYDCTFLASGQTGSGKTYTMGFESNASEDSKNTGMALRVLKSIFACHKATNVFISFVEVYNDQAFDLLRQNPQEAFYKKDHRVGEATKKSVQNEDEVNAILTQGTKNRRVRGTKMNSTSSRSHAVFTIIFGTVSGDQVKRESVINLVDLAGSECVRKTGATGEAHAEGKSINESLSAFRRVFAAMSSGAPHIPFRDSLITLILRDSLKIDCYLTLLGCVSPFKTDYGETLSTLDFVADAKQIKRTPQLNAIIDAFQLSNTPAKTSLHTPTSSIRSMKQPSPSAAKQNQSSISSRLSGERNQSHLRNSMSQKRFTRQSISNLRPKRTGLSPFRSVRANSIGAQRTQPKGNAVLSAMSCRKSLDTALQSEESINWNEAVDGEELQTNRRSIVPPDNGDILNVLESLENAFKERVKDGKEINQAAIAVVLDQLKAKLNALNPSIEVLFCPESIAATPIQSTMLSTVTEVTEIISDKNTDTNESNTNRVSSSCLVIEPINVADRIASISSANDLSGHLDPTVNVSINYDRIEQKILFNVEMNCNSIENASTTPETQAVMEPNTDLWECEERCNKDGSLSVKSQHESTRYKGESFEAIVSSTTIGDSPIISKKNSNENVRTPIGKLVIRKVAPASDFESTRYTVETINRTYQPLEVRAPMNYSDFCETPTSASNKLLMSTAIKHQTNRCAQRLPLSPRIILHRVSSPRKSPAPVRRTRSTRTTTAETGKKAKPQSKKIDERQRILEILNTGSDKDLQKLARIGKKTAAQIIKYRNQKGPLKRIEELLEMNWTKNMFQRFISSNIFE